MKIISYIKNKISGKKLLLTFTLLFNLSFLFKCKSQGVPKRTECFFKLRIKSKQRSFYYFCKILMYEV